MYTGLNEVKMATFFARPKGELYDRPLATYMTILEKRSSRKMPEGTVSGTNVARAQRFCAQRLSA